MLYTYKYIKKNRMEKLNQYIKHYFRTMYYTQSNSFSLSMLHVDFRKLVIECPKLKEYLTNIFDVYKKLEKDKQTFIYTGFKKNNLIHEVCTGMVEPIHYEDIPVEIRDLLKKFFYYLYDDLFGTTVYETTYCSFHDYHQQLLRENDSIAFCPFCGLFPLTDQGMKYRDDYDHFLPRSIYIFNSVNFKNLVPMCNICNSKVKGDKDVIFKRKSKAGRRKVCYPYSGVIKLGDIKVTVDFNHAGNMVVKLDHPSVISEEIESWIDIFDINNRYEGVVTNSSKRWSERFRKKYKRCIDKDPSLKLSDFVEDELQCIDERGSEERSFLEKAYLEFISQLDSFESDLKETVGVESKI